MNILQPSSQLVKAHFARNDFGRELQLGAINRRCRAIASLRVRELAVKALIKRKKIYPTIGCCGVTSRANVSLLEINGLRVGARVAVRGIDRRVVDCRHIARQCFGGVVRENSSIRRNSRDRR